MVKVCQEYTNDKYNDSFAYFAFPLSNFQKWAIESTITGNHCLVSSSTGNGKTITAEFAIQYFKSLGKKVIYTGPIKALCNQKLYDFRRKYPHISFGILTGDIKDNPEADVLIMTTEILRNTLFNRQVLEKDINTDTSTNITSANTSPLLSFDMDFENELGAVVFDEVHYIGDKDRGSVWEQSIILLPKHVQLIMLSATIHKPENFAKWVEDQKNIGHDDNQKKEVYLCSTCERVVPLTHYMWVTCHKSTIKEAKDTPLEVDLKKYINNQVVITDSTGKFNELNYHKIKSIQTALSNNKSGFVKRSFVLNGLIKHMKDNNMLPALCFVFSRKKVEICAKEITFSLFDSDDKTPSIIENECKQILIRKIPNYKEYVNLPEYTELMELLKKGIAIHHAGIMPILREIVELLFEKNYIKLLFATETFAVGINMPTKSVIFSSLSKFDGNGMRNLLPHEYTQMAGRAGRRGLDTIGNVIHCNNLFSLDSVNEYKKIMTGGSQQLTSQFKISFNLILNIIYSNTWDDDFNIDKFKSFISKSMIQDSLDSEVEYYEDVEKEMDDKIKQSKNIVDSLTTPREIMDKYKNLKSQTNVRNNQRKKISKEISAIERDYSSESLKSDIEKYDNYLSLTEEYIDNTGYKNNVKSYVETNIQNVLKILNDNHFITPELKILEKGIISSQIQEVHSLMMGDLYVETQGFKDFTTQDLVCMFSCFTNIRVDDTIKIHKCGNHLIQFSLKQAESIFEKYDIIQTEHFIPNDTESNMHLELIYIMYDWCEANTEEKCKEVIWRVKEEKQIFLGDFVKAIIKINNIAAELEKICEILNNMDLKERLSRIGEMTQKYVATNQSLYI